MDQELKAIALTVLESKLKAQLGTEHPEELYWATLDEFGRVKQTLTVQQVKREIENETPTGESYLLAAAVDPDNKLTSEYNVTNNSMRRTADCSTPLRWAAQWLFWVQTFLLEVGFFL